MDVKNWDWGRAIPIKGIHKWDFRCSVAKAYYYTGTNRYLSRASWPTSTQGWRPRPRITRRGRPEGGGNSRSFWRMRKKEKKKKVNRIMTTTMNFCKFLCFLSPLYLVKKRISLWFILFSTHIDILCYLDYLPFFLKKPNFPQIRGVRLFF